MARIKEFDAVEEMEARLVDLLDSIVSELSQRAPERDKSTCWSNSANLGDDDVTNVLYGILLENNFDLVTPWSNKKFEWIDMRFDEMGGGASNHD